MSFTLGTKTAKELGILMLRSSQRPVLPNSRDNRLVIPGKNGAKDYGGGIEPRLFSLECAFSTRNAAELQNRVSALAQHLVDSYGRPRELVLRFDSRSNQSYTVRYSGSLGIERVAGLGQFTLPLIAADPFAYEPERIYETTITSNPFPFVIQSSGNVRTEPIIMLTNTGNNTIHGFTIINEYEID